MRISRLVPASVVAVFAVFGITGCHKEPVTAQHSSEPPAKGPYRAPQSRQPNGTTMSSPGAGQSNSVNVAPIGSGAAGPMTPVTGAENLGGGGYGVGQAAKDQARKAAMKGSGSMGSASGDDQ